MRAAAYFLGLKMIEISKTMNIQSKLGSKYAIWKASAMPPVRAATYFWGLKMSESSKIVDFQSKLGLKV